MSGEARVQAGTLAAAGIAVRAYPAESPATVVIDAVFGTGLTRPAVGRELEFSRHALAARAAGAWVIAADVPSGLDADRGAVVGEAVRADETITFGEIKKGLPAAAEWTGRVRVAPLGLPAGWEGARVSDSCEAARIPD